MDSTPVASPLGEAQRDERPVDTLGKEVRESFLLLGLSLGVTAGLTFALQAALSLVG